MNITDYVTPVSGLQYFVCMIDNGNGPRLPKGFRADVAPEYTRRQIIEEVRGCIFEKDLKIVHVKFVDGNDFSDVTHEIVGEAIDAQADYEAEQRALDGINNRIAAQRDHAGDLRKHSVSA